ncbi:MAG: prepilin-type N-terminal cleavage/methylation domain-containing protein [Terriglobia bacterium]|jgi:prepilin-type N-terminal cleavage/methylation domain-containing protein
MSQSPVRKHPTAESGFTMVEVMVALSILVVGLMATALLMANVYKNTVRSRYMAMAAQLASEKLEDLNRFQSTDPRICTSGGSLTADTVPVSKTCNSQTDSVNYYDTITLNLSNGAMTETYEQLSGTTVQYVTQTFSPDGVYQAPTTSNTAPTGTTFKRRWVVEQDTPITGVRMITVLVTLLDNTIQPPVTFQMSMVRP